MKVGDWIVKHDRWSDYIALGPVSKVTAKRCYHPDRWAGGREAFTDAEDIVLTADEPKARLVAEKLKSSRALRDQERDAASARHTSRRDRIVAEAKGTPEDGAPRQDLPHD